MKPAAATAISVAPFADRTGGGDGAPGGGRGGHRVSSQRWVRFARSGDGRQRRAGPGGNRLEVERVDRRREPVAALAAGLDVLDRAAGRPEGPAVDDPGRRPTGRVGAGD